MAIGPGIVKVLIWLRQTGHLQKPGAVIEIGAQQLVSQFFDHTWLNRVAEQFGVDPQIIWRGVERPPVADRGNGIGSRSLARDAPLARLFWEWLGFRYAAIDIDGAPGSIPLDLNYDSAGPADCGRYDVVTNFGTTEHVANQLNAFKVIHDLAAPGGIMLHNLPTQGNCGHGLVNYNAKFFWMLARSNCYEWLYADYIRDGGPHDLPQDIIDWVTPHRPDFAERARAIQVTDAGIIVALRKARDIAFVPPLDVNTGTKPPNRTFAERYWTVFGETP
jgi:SAM-dependent methyltransferase